MALIIENGSQVLNSDSYVTRAEYIAFALSVGIVIADEEAADNQLRKSAFFIASKESRLIGTKVDRDQSMSYPRYNLYIEDYYWSSDEIPAQVKNAQMNLALDVNEGVDLYNPPASESVAVKKEKIDGAVEVEYSTRESDSFSRQSQSNALLVSLMGSTGMSISLVRA